MSKFHLDYTKKSLPSKVTSIGFLLLLIGAVSIAAGFALAGEHAMLRLGFNSLISFAFVFSVGIGSLFLVALEYIAGAVWSVPFRRVAEIFATLLVVAPILAIPVWMNLHGMYHWTHLEEVAKDVMLSNKQPYLNESFFYIRTAVIFALLILFYVIFTKSSIKQDSLGASDQTISKRNIKFSAAFMMFFAFAITIVAVDYLMSLEPHWFSTIFGVYYFAGSFWVSIAVITITSLMLNENGYLAKGINKNHWYSLGGLMFAFTAFWTYIAFSQFMLIWYANVPEETFWFLPRLTGAYGVMSALLILIHFIVPFGLLIQRPSKLNPNRLKLAGFWIIFAHFYDLYWLAMPTYSKITNDSTPPMGFMELGFPIFSLGLIIVVFTMVSKGKNLIPVGDPKLQRAMEFHL